MGRGCKLSGDRESVKRGDEDTSNHVDSTRLMRRREGKGSDADGKERSQICNADKNMVKTMPNSRGRIGLAQMEECGTLGMTFLIAVLLVAAYEGITTGPIRHPHTIESTQYSGNTPAFTKQHGNVLGVDMLIRHDHSCLHA